LTTPVTLCKLTRIVNERSFIMRNRVLSVHLAGGDPVLGGNGANHG
jgi:hypothetical protein